MFRQDSFLYHYIDIVDFQSFLLLFENHFRNYFCSFLECSDFGSQVSSTPSLRNSRISIELLLKQAHVTIEERKVVPAALKREEETGAPAAAMELAEPISA